MRETTECRRCGKRVPATDGVHTCSPRCTACRHYRREHDDAQGCQHVGCACPHYHDPDGGPMRPADPERERWLELAYEKRQLAALYRRIGRRQEERYPPGHREAWNVIYSYVCAEQCLDEARALEATV